MATNHPEILSGYETTFITRSELSDEALRTLQERVGQIVTSFNGETVLSEDWGKRKLAYPIEKETRGHYTYVVYTGKPGVVHEIERNLRLHDHVLRFLTVNLAEEFDSGNFKKQRADVQAAAKRREEEREARREERAERRGYDDRRHDDDVEEVPVASDSDEE
ncbi:MAG: 30S ribosomal protein S6 [Bdellovibrio sp.]|nr:30S ribosomal protein S6 [Bdellovibrio sp.]